MAIRIRAAPSKRFRTPSRVVWTLPRSTTVPDSSSTQIWLVRSPKSIPTVLSAIPSVPFPVLRFFTAGLLLGLEPATSLQRIFRLRWGDRPSHPISASVAGAPSFSPLNSISLGGITHRCLYAEPHVNISLALILLLAAPTGWKALQCQGTPVTGRYTNNGLGFSVAVPAAHPGRRGLQGGPERGVSVPLGPGCEAVIVIYAEPNTLEWRTPADAIASRASVYKAEAPNVRLTSSALAIGTLPSAGLLAHPSATSDTEELVIAFGPKTGLVYTAMLVSPAARFARDEVVFRKFLQSFRLEPWR